MFSYLLNLFCIKFRLVEVRPAANICDEYEVKESLNKEFKSIDREF